ncbi:MAG: hypothetical protein WDO56_26610 [Gammaproteobacteria bacterium]
MSEAPDSDLFMSRVDALLNEEAIQLSPLAAGIMVAIDMGIADSRSFSRLLGVEHALVLREITNLSGADGLVTVTARRAKTLRTSLALSARGARLLRERCGAYKDTRATRSSSA